MPVRAVSHRSRGSIIRRLCDEARKIGAGDITGKSAIGYFARLKKTTIKWDPEARVKWMSLTEFCDGPGESPRAPVSGSRGHEGEPQTFAPDPNTSSIAAKPVTLGCRSSGIPKRRGPGGSLVYGRCFLLVARLLISP